MGRPLPVVRGVATLPLLFFVLFGVAGDAQRAGAPAEQPAVSQAPAGAASQPAPPAQDPNVQQPVFRAGINYVRVDVIVSDRDGNPIADLNAADFEVTEDGKRQTVDTFKLIRLDGGVTLSGDGPPRPIVSASDEETQAARDDVRLFGVFLDDYHVRRSTSLMIREPLIQFIQNQLGPSDMVGLMGPLDSVYGIRMTRSRSTMTSTIEKFVGRKFEYDPRNEIESRYAHQPAEAVEQIRNQVSLSAIKGFIIRLGTLKEGRKALLLVSEGYTNILPPQLRDAIASVPGTGNPNRFNPMAGVNDPAEDTRAFFAGGDLAEDLREVYDAANRNNVAIYTIDPRGLATGEFGIDQVGISAQLSQQYLSSTMDTVRQLADQTDGRAIVNRNDFGAAMKQIVRDSSAYYLLGYASSQAPTDGQFHNIVVRVKRPGVQVRARKGYWAPTAADVARATAAPKPALAKPLADALESVAAPIRSRLIRTWIGAARAENGKTKMTFVWEPSPVVAGERDRQVPARVMLTAIAEDGAPYFRGRVQAPASTSPASATAPAQVSFNAPPGKVQLRVSIEGASSEVLDTETREIVVPDLTGPDIVLGTPLVFRARTARDVQQLKGDQDAVPVASREFSRTDRLFVRISSYGAAPASLAAQLLNRSGQPMAQVPVTPGGVAGTQQIDLSLAGLAPGEYVLEIRAASPATDAAKQLVAFRVTG